MYARRESEVIGARCLRAQVTVAIVFCLILTPGLPGAYGQEGGASKGEEAAAVGDDDLQERWNMLKKVEAADLARKHIRGLVRAAHLYHDAHGAFPPAVVSNPKLPAGKRLSGLVLLLPYLGAECWLDKGKPCFDKEVVELAREVYKSIDLTKAWDDPANLNAAKRIVPAFLAPQNGAFRNQQGYAVTHFAFVQGGSNGLDGAFPGTQRIKVSDITDGTVHTLAIGQIAKDHGPWMAEGLSTARQVHPPTEDTPGTFGSLYHKSGCYFATCDSSVYFLKFNQTTNPLIEALSTRAGGDATSSDYFFAILKTSKNPFEP